MQVLAATMLLSVAGVVFTVAMMLWPLWYAFSHLEAQLLPDAVLMTGAFLGLIWALLDVRRPGYWVCGLVLVGGFVWWQFGTTDVVDDLGREVRPVSLYLPAALTSVFSLIALRVMRPSRAKGNALI